MKKSIVSKSSLSGLVAVVVALFVFSTAAMAQVENPSQITVQGTALITKDSTSDNPSTSRQSTKSGGFLVGYSYQFNSWAGAEGNYGYTRNTQNYNLNLDKVTHLAQPSLGFFIR